MCIRDSNLPCVRAVVRFHFRAGLFLRQRQVRHRAGFAMKLQFEPVRQHDLKHGRQFGAREGMIRLGVEIVEFGRCV